MKIITKIIIVSIFIAIVGIYGGIKIANSDYTWFSITETTTYCTITANDDGIHKVCSGNHTPMGFWKSIPASGGKLIYTDIIYGEEISSYELIVSADELNLFNENNSFGKIEDY